MSDNDGYSLGEFISLSKNGKQVLIESRPKYWLPLSDGGAGYRNVMYTASFIGDDIDHWYQYRMK